MKKDFYRISLLPPYVFAEVNRLKAEFRTAGRDIIDFGMGNPDQPTPQHIVDKLIETTKKPDTHGYSASKGINGLRKAICGYYERRFNVTLDPESEAIVTIGSKEGLANMANAISEEGDVILVPSPSYPIHEFGFIIAGAKVRQLPKYEGKTLKQQIEEAVADSAKKPKALILNYPCNPTAEVVGIDFYEEMVDLCKHYGIYILSDLAYCEIYFDEKNPPPSILQVKGAKDIAVEFTTMSKTYNMAGWRVGFACGNKKLIYALTRIKSYLDYGAFTPIQVAAAHALNSSQDCVVQIRKTYKDRRDVLVKGLHEAGWMIDVPQASMFAWAKLPDKYLHLGSMEFSKLLMEKADVAVAPGIGFGKHGDQYVRIGLVENKQRIRQATKNIKKFLKYG